MDHSHNTPGRKLIKGEMPIKTQIKDLNQEEKDQIKSMLNSRPTFISKTMTSLFKYRYDREMISIMKKKMNKDLYVIPWMVGINYYQKRLS